MWSWKAVSFLLNTIAQKHHMWFGLYESSLGVPGLP